MLNDPSLMQHVEKEPVRMWYWGPMFRYERPQKGRMRQFYQLGIENVGGSAPHKDQKPDYGYMIQTDLEAICSAASCLDMIFEHKLSFVLHLNTLGSRSTISSYNDDLLKFLSDKSHLLSQDS